MAHSVNSIIDLVNQILAGIMVEVKFSIAIVFRLIFSRNMSRDVEHNISLFMFAGLGR